MAHTNPIISKIKLPNSETPYDICDKDAIHQDDELITIDDIDTICGASIVAASEVTF